jgi:hypothetical protein
MVDSRIRDLWREQAETLGEIGAVLARADLPEIEVRLPKVLARAAVEAWEEDEVLGPLEPETTDQRLERHRAGSLGLIGLAVTEHGRDEGEEVVVALGPDLIGAAVDAADDLPPR